ncbi:MAG: SAM-dependent DNA methyltransferase [Selenomonadaceae bacterium]|nr:SAM-dependent DNA methyltransferase [Selenomonadaceae bacterium]
MNPPFSQKEEPERNFIDAAMDTLQTLGLMAVVVKSGIFADDDNSLWRNEFLKRHTLLGMISLPGDLFYPTAVDTTIMIAQAKRPQESNDKVFMAKIWNDGYKKLKGKRVETSGSQLKEVLSEFKKFKTGKKTTSSLVTVIKAEEVMKKGAEFCPEQYLPQPDFPEEEQKRFREEIIKSILRTAVSVDDIADEVIPDFPKFPELSKMPYGTEDNIEKFFHVKCGKSRGESNYNDGSCPYVSSGDSQNSIIRLVADVESELFDNGAITVTCFGKASVQPWRFMARGNGGSAVRVLIPRYKMTFSELVWFAAQINMQKWRFFYGRMAILGRLKRIKLVAPKSKIDDTEKTISEKVAELSKKVADILNE